MMNNLQHHSECKHNTQRLHGDFNIKSYNFTFGTSKGLIFAYIITVTIQKTYLMHDMVNI